MNRHPLDPGPHVRAFWTKDSAFRRASAHYDGHHHINVEAWGEHVLDLYEWDDRDDAFSSNKNWLEWGCGGGSVARKIKARCEPKLYHAVDLSMDALDECRRSVADGDDDSCGWFEMYHPWTTNTIESGSVDHIVSTSVFQHFPSFDYARAVLAEMRRVAAPEARGLINTHYFMPGDHYDPTTMQKQPYTKTFGRYCSWQVPEFWRELKQAGFAPTDVVLEPETQFAWYRFGVK